MDIHGLGGLGRPREATGETHNLVIVVQSFPIVWVTGCPFQSVWVTGCPFQPAGALRKSPPPFGGAYLLAAVNQKRCLESIH